MDKEIENEVHMRSGGTVKICDKVPGEQFHLELCKDSPHVNAASVLPTELVLEHFHFSLINPLRCDISSLSPESFSKSFLSNSLVLPMKINWKWIQLSDLKREKWKTIIRSIISFSGEINSCNNTN